VVEMNEMVLRVKRRVHQVADDVRVLGDLDRERIFHRAHRCQRVHAGAHAADAFDERPRVARVAALQDQLDAAEHGGARPGVPDGATVHLAQRDVTFVAISRAPLAEIEAFKRRMGWRFPWVSSFGSDFNFDFHVSFKNDEVGKNVEYNYERQEIDSDEMPGASVFYKDETGTVFHTYSAYARGLDILVGAYNFLDLTPKGRDEDELPWTMAWVRRHDEYGK